MHKNLVGQTHKQKRNCKEQKKRRDHIKERFPKTITYYTYENVAHKIDKRAVKIGKIFDKLELKLRKSELSSLAITSYIVCENKDKRRLFRFISNQLIKNNISIDKLILELNKNFSSLEEWNQDILIEYLFFKR